VSETPTQQLLSAAALASFKLNGRFLALAEELARPVGLTAAWWQVLGAVLGEPLTVSGIAREMGITRQSVQRIADLLVERGLAEYHDNPAHRRAKLLAPTAAGRRAVDGLDPAHAAAARRLVADLGAEGVRSAIAAMRDVTAALERMEGAR
jgi:DNA-binding MarR family transcriptional regulator